MNQKKRNEVKENYTTKLENLDIQLKPAEDEISPEQKLKVKKEEREHLKMIIVIFLIGFLVLFLITFFWDNIVTSVLEWFLP
jgi:hypothetical protein